MRSTITLSLTVLMPAAVLGCGSGSDERGGEAIPYEELPSRLAVAYCEGLGACCRDRGLSFDDAACRGAATPYFASALPDKSSTTDYSPAGGGECLAELVALYSTCQDRDRLGVLCRKAFKGRLPLGAACSEHYECATTDSSYALCWSADAYAESVCVSASRLANGHISTA